MMPSRTPSHSRAQVHDNKGLKGTTSYEVGRGGATPGGGVDIGIAPGFIEEKLEDVTHVTLDTQSRMLHNAHMAALNVRNITWEQLRGWKMAAMSEGKTLREWAMEACDEKVRHMRMADNRRRLGGIDSDGGSSSVTQSESGAVGGSIRDNSGVEESEYARRHRIMDQWKRK